MQVAREVLVVDACNGRAIIGHHVAAGRANGVKVPGDADDGVEAASGVPVYNVATVEEDLGVN